MYELFTLGGGTYLVDLLNAVAAITSGGAYVTLAQLAGVGGLGWVLFRTAFGGSWKDNAKWMLLFVTVWGAMIVPKATVRVVDRLDPALAPAVVANVPIGLALFASLTSQVGDGLTRSPNRPSPCRTISPTSATASYSGPGSPPRRPAWKSPTRCSRGTCATMSGSACSTPCCSATSRPTI